ncbi:GRF-interacting factor 1-like [Phragmites australis]|uniref:GRF-interacting factor 1-like n=1 Tax=Phragmites australis TaxID=29695 RepID=UPI002D781BFD|nr:GRF-interacting factor 1-like [Phragmites australis]
MQQQHLMQMNQSMMGGYASPTAVTTDLIQQYLDENKQLILAILDNQNNGKVEECERNQAKLQHNLMYLAAIADSQPPQTAPLSQYPSNMMMQPGARYMPPQSAQMMSPQSLMAARSSMMFAHPSLSPLQQQQAAAAAAHGQMGMASGGGTTSGFNILHGEANMGAGAGNSMMNAGMFSGFGRGGGSASGAKEGSTSLSVGANSGAQSGDGDYMKTGTEEEGS